MDFPFTQEEWGEILARIYKRAAADHQFHVLCLRNSHAAIKLVCGRDVPEHFQIRFEAQHPGEVVLVLPLENRAAFQALSENDLDEIAHAMAAICVPFSQRASITDQSPT